MLIAFRADSNKFIGTGHVMRCLAIADELAALGNTPVFITVSPQTEQMVRQKNYRCQRLSGRYDDLSLEIDELCNWLFQEEITSIFLDTYYVTQAYIDRIRETGSVGMMYDYGPVYQVDLFVNYNINCHDQSYSMFAPDTNMLLGLSYVPLRKEFQRCYDCCIHAPVRNILITTGGTDPHFIAGQIINRSSMCGWFKTMKFHVVVGQHYLYQQDLQRLSEQCTNIILHEHTEKMSELMIQSDIAISASGTTLYELNCCKIPTVAFSMAENQEALLAGFVKQGMVLNGGSYLKQGNACIDQILFQVQRLISDTALCRQLTGTARSLDGMGAKRIAQALVASSKSHH